MKRDLFAELARFYTDNPGEELTKEQIMAKYGSTNLAVMAALRKLIAAGLVECFLVVTAKVAA